MSIKTLVINPGSTSTKVSYFENEKNIYTESIFHDAPELLRYPTVNDQIPLRLPCRNDISGDTRSDRVDNQRGGRIRCGVSACLSRKEPCGGCRKQLCDGFCLREDNRSTSGNHGGLTWTNGLLPSGNPRRRSLLRKNRFSSAMPLRFRTRRRRLISLRK